MTELVEQLGRELAVLGLREAQLEASRNAPQVRRAGRDAAGALVTALAFLAAFALANVAAVIGLSSVMPAWAAALVVAAAWTAIGAALSLAFVASARRWPVWSVFASSSADVAAELERGRDEALAAVRTTLELLGPAVAVGLASAAVPMAGDLAGDLAGSVVDAGDDLLDASDEIVEALAAEIPAGSVVNQIWDVALMPGRFGLRVATTVLRREPPTEETE
jgi:hypothetical protein